MKILQKLSIDNIVFDEAHLIKGDIDETKRVERIKSLIDQQPQAKILAMTATPCINTVGDGINLFEMITRRKIQSNLEGKDTVGQAIELPTEEQVSREFMTAFTFE